MRKRAIVNIILALGMLWGVVPLSSGLGISPGILTIDFSPNQQFSGAFTLYNRDSQPLTVSLNAQGELAALMTLPSEITLAPSSSKLVSYTLMLPLALTPGFHAAEIIAIEQRPSTPGQTRVEAVVAVMTQIKVLVPYPDQYPVLDLNIIKQPAPLQVSLAATNLGQQEIQRASATIRIIDQAKVLETLTTETLSIPPQQRRELVARWQTIPEPGTYTAEATLHYDSKEKTIEKEFSITTASQLIIKSMEVKEFIPDKLVIFETEVENTGNTPAEEVKAQVIIYDEAGNVLSTITSPTTVIRPHDSEMVELHWEIAGIPRGSYTSQLILHYAGNTLEMPLSIEVTEEKVRTSFKQPITGKASALPGRTPLSLTLISMGGGVIILIIVVVIVTVKKVRKQPLKPRQTL